MAPSPSRARGAVAGVAGAAVSLGVGELVAGVLVGVPSPVVAVGSGVIALAPSIVERAAIAVFGLADKLALNTGTVVLALAIAAALGIATRTRRWVASVGWLGFGVLGMVAAAQRPYASLPLIVVSYAFAVGAGLAALRWLLLVARPRRTGGYGSPAPHSSDDGSGSDLPTGTEGAYGVDAPEFELSSVGRRRFVVASGGVLVGAGFLALIGRAFLERARSVGGASIALPTADRPAAPPPPAASFDVPGISPIVVPNEDFYRIDTALLVPRVDASTWRLRITGMVDREVELTYEDLLAMRLVESYVTIACVSNEVGGGLVGNAAWLGVPLDDVLALAGVRDGATQIVGRSVDRWTAGFPTEAAFDGRGALVAIGMNGEPLPATHGFPARLIVPGLYGYVSATKWLEEIELTTWEAFDAYWVPRGWSKEGPVHTQSRIDVPRGRVAAGPTTVAGVAWAPQRGISAVEVRVDDGEWIEAELSESLSDDAWRQWRIEWDATPGAHRLAVRATDGAGEVQTDERTDPFPAGATGYHSVRVSVG